MYNFALFPAILPTNEVTGVKAILLSLENGEGLRPVPTGGTLLGAPVLGKSLLEWNARALRESGAAELLLALPEDAQVPAQDVLPMSVRRFPAGTGELEALAVCASGLEEDFCLLRGGLWWSGDLRPALAAHRAGGFSLTRVQFPAGAPLQGGTERGRVLPFPEKTLGLALCSPALCPALTEVRDWPALFSRLRAAGALGTAGASGRWDRVDSPSGLLRVTAALLSAKRLEGSPLRPGIWSRSPLPEDAELVPPCAIGANVRLGKGCLVGPHAVVEDGAAIGDHSLVQCSILQKGAQAGSRTTVYGGVVCERARLGRCAVLNEGAAVGADALVGEGAVLMEGVRVDAGTRVPASVRLSEDLSADAPAWTVEDMVRLGRRLGRCGAVGTGGAGFRGLLLARAFGCGAAAQGAAVVLHDGLSPRQAAWLAGYYRWPASLFAGEDGQVYLFDSQGQALSAPPPDGETGTGSWDLLAGTASACAAAVERGDGPACAAFRPCKGRVFL